MKKVNPSTNRNRKAYETPAVVYEAPLEVRAGSPLAMPDGLEELFPGQ